MPNKIFIPDSCEHTQALRVLVEPPSDKMYIQLCDSENGKSFQEGKIEGKRTRELAIFMFRPMKLIEEGNTVREQVHLKKGDKVLVKVQVYDSKKEKTESEKLVEVL